MIVPRKAIADETGIRTEIRRVIRLECKALEAIEAKVDDAAARAVEVLHDCRGRVLVTGMRKTGLIGRKIAATLASTGTPAFFLHPADAYHGDRGVNGRMNRGESCRRGRKSSWDSYVPTIRQS